MALYQSEVHLAALNSYPGEQVEIDDADADRYEVDALVEAGFLTRVGRPREALGVPEPEVLSTVGQPDAPELDAE